MLKVRTCKKAPAEAHMKLAQHSGSKKTEEKKKKKNEGGWAVPQDDAGDGMEMMSDAAPVESYCSEGWSSVCNFFVRFFEG